MIKTIVSNSPSLVVNASSIVGPYISPGAVGAGMMRWNGNTGSVEVNDGNSWLTLAQGSASVQLTPEAEETLRWARELKQKQQRRDELVAQNPALAKALEAIARAEADFDLLAKFVENDRS